jgi:hypothetical protein
MRRFLSRFSMGLVGISLGIGAILLAGGNNLGILLVIFSLMCFLKLTIISHINRY